jgi:hypothetical protein
MNKVNESIVFVISNHIFALKNRKSKKHFMKKNFNARKLLLNSKRCYLPTLYIFFQYHNNWFLKNNPFWIYGNISFNSIVGQTANLRWRNYQTWSKKKIFPILSVSVYFCHFLFICQGSVAVYTKINLLGCLKFIRR